MLYIDVLGKNFFWYSKYCLYKLVVGNPHILCEKIIAQKEAAGLWLEQNHQSEVRYENIFDKVERLTTNFLNEWDGNVQINFPMTFHMP